MNRFEQLIEYVINDEEHKAQELFHEIVVEKSRQIYESLMQEEAEEEIEEGAEEESDEEELDEDAMGGDASDDLIDEVEVDEESDINMEAEDGEDMGDGEDGEDMGDGEDMSFGGNDMGDEGGSEPATKGDILDLESKLDELMAEFEAAMGGDEMGNGDGFGPDEGGDAIEMDDTEEMDEVGMMEAVSLKAAPRPVTSEEGNINKKSTVAANSGAAGMASKPVSATGTEAKGRPAPTTKDLIGDFQNKAGTSMKDLSAATKPHLAQASGVNTKSPLPAGRRG
jgi:hypothetical protein